MKKILLLLVVYILGFGMLSAQEMKYFKVEKTTYDNMLRLVPPGFPELKGPSGYYSGNPDKKILTKKIRSSFSEYCKKNNWYPERKKLEKHPPIYSFYFDKDMKVMSYKILVFSDIFLLMDEDQLREVGETAAKVLNDNLSLYYHIDRDRSPSFNWSCFYLPFRILLKELPE